MAVSDPEPGSMNEDWEWSSVSVVVTIEVLLHPLKHLFDIIFRPESVFTFEDEIEI